MSDTTEPDADASEWEWAPLRFPSDVSRPNAAAQLTLHAEYGGWELARVVRYVDGSRRVTLRRRRTKTSVPLPGLTA